ncbi:MAG: cation transporter [Saprospiraceae bacterium]|uniref:Cation transporter n=1 Tax=Candidatus Opimibacter skivensis TaxID=2982028 RepID=A0A9D7SX21_9BACT|nr:cation transporter [Candidatus Opimibacter skivensis]MBK9983806.1 cation transporter [Candidatus Opimibacter skivensis]
MSDSHTHHVHSAALNNVNAAFIIGIGLNLLFVIIEGIAGLFTHSLSLLSDAGHNLADVGSLALSLLAFRLLKVKSTKLYTYGYRKTSILVALFNAMVLFVVVGAIIYEAAHRFFYPEPIPGLTISIVAGVGIVINSVTALLFLRDKDKDLNIKSAYLHLMSDAFISLGIVIGGIIIYYTHWFWVDSVVSISVAIFILFSTWRLLKGSLRLSLDGVPENISLDDIKTIARQVDGVKDVHHVHIWAISTTENAMTAHLVLGKNVSCEEEQKIKHDLKHEFLHLNIHHSTLETERENVICDSEDC